DGLVSRTPGLAVGVFSADCVPILLWTDDARTVGAFHGGWRGLAAGIGRAAVAAMGGGARLSASVGPRIGACCYRVGPELAGSFADERFERRDGGLFLDLGAEALSQLTAAGVAAERVSVSSLCTSCRPELSSWRRDRVRSNMLSFVAPRPA
ncbi:MAG: polyphenol oxidase family protein, partial [Elusimicrobia bacterium]|nr:polyphenol oxidase family protein [Elusimicrobiota bacterium]